MALLGVNIDHIATIRTLRQTNYPSLTHAALIAMESGADFITVHLREDRRHIIDTDLPALLSLAGLSLNLEIANTPEMIAIAQQLKPAKVCIVPENRQELTTEGGLDVIAHQRALHDTIRELPDSIVSLFIDPTASQITAAAEIGSKVIELHTGSYAAGLTSLTTIAAQANYARTVGLEVHAGHGLNYQNVAAIATINSITTLNIGHAIVAQSIFCGLASAVQEMKNIIRVHS